MGQSLDQIAHDRGRSGAIEELKSGSLPTYGGKPAPSKAKHGGGFSFGHLLAKTGSDLYDTAVHSPSGIYELAKAAGHDNAALLGHTPIGTAYDRKAAHEKSQLLPAAKATAKGFEQDFQHPLRHPGNTLLDAVGALSLGAGTVARAGELGRALKAGETAGEVARAAVKGPRPIPRNVEFGGEKVGAGFYSRSALRRSSQRLYDKLQQRFPETRIGVVTRTLPERVGHEALQNRRITEAISRAPAQHLAQVRLGADRMAKQKALQVVAEGVPVEDRILFHQKQLETLKGKAAASTRKELALLEGAKKYVHNVEVDGRDPMPRINPSEHKLIDAYQQAHAVAHQREEILGNTEKVVNVKTAEGATKAVRTQALNAASREGRIEAPAAVIRAGIGKTNYGFDPQLVPELFRFPYSVKKALPAIDRVAGYKGGNPREPGSITKQFQGKLLTAGVARNDTTKLVSESYLEAHRFSALMRNRDDLLRMAHDTKSGENDIPIRTDALKNQPWPKAINDLSEKDMTAKDVHALSMYYDEARQHVFPSEASLAADEKYLATGVHPDVKWIDKRVLGGLNEPNPLVGITSRGSGKKAITAFDSVNNAERAAILYLKPAYAVPNILGNAALNIVQQGWAAPAQVGRTVRLWRDLSPELKTKVKLAMGEGISGSLHSEAGPLSKSVNAMAEVWQKPVDTPFRVNSFLYEARRSGFKTAADIEKLFKNEDMYVRVAREASAAAIDYGNLGPIEQSIIRRVIFFYPWVKGSSQYAGRFLTTHSAQAAALGQLGKQGAAKDKKDLGPLPSYAEGLFKIGDRHGEPMVVNPASAGILQTPAQMLKTATEVTSGHPGEAFQMTQNFTPAVQAFMDLVGASHRRRGQSELNAAKDTLIGGLPLLTTIQQELHPPSGGRPRMYPRDRRDVLLHYLLGGLAPSPLNRGKARAAKYTEDRG